MPLLPDVWVATTLGLVAFFLFLGLLVVFVDHAEVRRVVATLLALQGVAVLLVVTEEIGLAVIALSVFAAIVADQLLERFAGA